MPARLWGSGYECGRAAGSLQSPPSHSQLAVAYSVCRHIARASAKNFYYAFLVLPRHKRQALCAVYAFMRRCDDIADDESIPVRERHYKLTDALDALHRAQAGEPTDDAVLLALTDTQRRYDIPADLLDQLAYGTMMDVNQSAVENAGASTAASNAITVQYRTFEDLYQYCYRVASVVGLVCIRVFGYRDPRGRICWPSAAAWHFSSPTSFAMSKKTPQMGRVYLPERDLATFGISADELSTATNPVRFGPLLAMESQSGS